MTADSAEATNTSLETMVTMQCYCTKIGVTAYASHGTDQNT